jgi:hypothetical protein
VVAANRFEPVLFFADRMPLTGKDGREYRIRPAYAARPQPL